jgi:hypothetical protein
MLVGLERYRTGRGKESLNLMFSEAKTCEKEGSG